MLAVRPEPLGVVVDGVEGDRQEGDAVAVLPLDGAGLNAHESGTSSGQDPGSA